ncbi:FAD binding domain-containing protein [Siccirubricoccus phaeus]|uniref:FAD binding domain-containing protein n=1 Tax=Siccirubricoccus phaeus TaxID=2595053 RepID=UPI0011F277B9|nr:FAD binding domain-containing protein [Siccirubricoccus phaeus]
MKSAAFEHLRAASIGEAAALLAEGETRLLAGGQSLGPMLNLRLARPRRLVDVKRIPALRALAADARMLRLGAGWTHAEIEDGVVEDSTRGLLRHVAHGIAYRAVRNRGTIGGSLAHADPAADWLATLVGLGATVTIEGRAGEQRRLAVEKFCHGAFATDLAEDEVLEAVELPRLSPQARWGYHKICRKTGEFAKAIGIAVLDPGRGLARIVAGAVDGPPVLLPESSAALLASGAAAAGAALPEEVALRLAHLPAAEQALRLVALRRALAGLAGA